MIVRVSEMCVSDSFPLVDLLSFTVTCSHSFYGLCKLCEIPHPHSLSQFHSYALSLTLTHSQHTPSLSRSLSQSLSLDLIHSRSLSLSRSLLTLTQSIAGTHISQSLTHLVALLHSPSLSVIHSH